MKNSSVVKTSLALVSSLALLGCTTPGAPLKYGSEPVVHAPAAAPVADQPQVSGTFVGTVTGGNMAKGVGFSNLNVRLFVTQASGEAVVFFVRSDSKVFDASGKAVDYLEASRIKGKRVSIEYFVIQDATGGEPGRTDFAYEIGQRGVSTLRILAP